MALTKGPRKNPEGRMGLGEHVKEARNRIIKSLIGLVFGAVGGWLLYNPVVTSLSSPLRELAEETHRTVDLNYSTVGSPFDFQLRIAIQIGLVISSPVWIYQIWAFVTPGLTQKERKYTLGFMAAAVPLFLAGVWVAWNTIPNVVRALLHFTPQSASNIINADEYLTFATHMLLFLGIAFLVPVLMVGLNMAGILSGKMALKSWRITVFLVFVLAAIAAPGVDAISMFMLAIPLLALFFVAIGLCLLNDKRRARKQAKENTETEENADVATPAGDLGKL